MHDPLFQVSLLDDVPGVLTQSAALLHKSVGSNNCVLKRGQITIRFTIMMGVQMKYVIVTLTFNSYEWI